MPRRTRNGEYAMKEHALEYARQGFAVFPVQSPADAQRLRAELAKADLDEDERGKREKKIGEKKPFPGTRGVHEATTDEAKIKKRWTEWPEANIAWCPAMSLGGTVAVDLDVDKGDGEGGYSHEDLDALKLPRTGMAIRTPSGGLHLVYALKEGELLPPSTSKVGQKIDIRCKGSYGLLPPSKGPDGTEYTWKSRGDPAFRSDALVEAAGKARERDPKAEVWLIEQDLPEHDADYSEWLKGKAETGTCGVDGNHTLAKTGAMGHSFGLSEELTVERMLEHWNPRCEPPWSEEELRRHAGSGWRSATSPPGNLTKAYKKAERAAFFSEVKGDQAGKSAEVAPLPLETWDRTEPPPRKWLVEDWIPAGRLGSLYGKGGLGKSLLALQIAAAVMHGGKPVATQRLSDREQRLSDKDRAEASGIAKTLQGGQRVLWLSWEDETDEFKRRWRQAYRAEAITEEYPDPAWLGLVDMRKIGGALWGPDGAGGFNWTETGRRFLSMLEGYALAVIDPLAAAFMSSEIDRSQVRAFASALDRQAEESGCAVLIVGHPPKEEERSGKSGYSGSTDWRNAVRYMMLMETSDETGIQVHDDGKERKAGALRLRLDKASYAREDRHVWLERHYVKGPPTELAWRITSAKDAAKAYNPDKIIPECGSGTANGQGGSRKKLPLSARSDDP
ncbi:MAG: AAA family ATPase [Boseongicola sp. SB0665_bin_10]|nr:AAA family ATPase [Boseongicola sp. SB0665_bin_10]